MQDYLIIGQGLSGSLLACELIRHGQKVLVVDHPTSHSASYAAAGLLNPVTGMRFVESWQVHRLLPHAIHQYQVFEKQFGVSLFKSMPIFRFFKSEEEKKRWTKKPESEKNGDFIGGEFSEKESFSRIKNSYGGIHITGGGWLDVSLLRKKIKQYLIEHDAYIEDYFILPQLDSSSTISYRNRNFKKIVFCEGYNPKNTLFSWLQWKPAKGEILTLHSETISEDKILNRGLFVLPVGKQYFRVGATYEWKKLQLEPSEEGRSMLLEDLKHFVEGEWKVFDHRCGIRPILKDQKPVMGTLHSDPRIALFNGMGSKAGMVGPYYAQQLRSHLIEGIDIDAEVDVNRNM